METTKSRAYMTAASAARELGYTQGGYITRLCRAGKLDGAYQDGGIWLVPVAWVKARKDHDDAAGIERGTGRIGRPVTTGAGLKRKRPEYIHKPTGRPPGRPKKNPEK
jgi:hypothetical protein